MRSHWRRNVPRSNRQAPGNRTTATVVSLAKRGPNHSRQPGTPHALSAVTVTAWPASAAISRAALPWLMARDMLPAESS